MELHYIISTQVNAQAVNSEKLDTEIRSSNLIVEYAGLFVGDDHIVLYGDSVTNQAQLDSIIQFHDPDFLGQAKAQKDYDIDHRTRELISEGFPYAGKQFSLSIEAQLNWIAVLTVKDVVTYPFTITTVDEQEHDIVDSNDFFAFFMTGFQYKLNCVSTGRDLKVQVGGCATIAEVDAIVDNR